MHKLSLSEINGILDSDFTDINIALAFIEEMTEKAGYYNGYRTKERIGDGCYRSIQLRGAD